jgi:hypothetical protein
MSKYIARIAMLYELMDMALSQTLSALGNKPMPLISPDNKQHPYKHTSTRNIHTHAPTQHT